MIDEPPLDLLEVRDQEARMSTVRLKLEESLVSRWLLSGWPRLEISGSIMMRRLFAGHPEVSSSSRWNPPLSTLPPKSHA